MLSLFAGREREAKLDLELSIVRALGFDVLAGDRLHVHLHLTGTALLHGSRYSLLKLDSARLQDVSHPLQILP